MDFAAACDLASAPLVGKVLLAIAGLNLLSYGLDWLARKTPWKCDDGVGAALRTLVQILRRLVDFSIAKHREERREAGEDRPDRRAGAHDERARGDRAEDR